MDDRVTGGLRVECARPEISRRVWVYWIREHPDGRLYWRVDDFLPVSHLGKAKFFIPRCGNMAATPVTAREAEVVLGWPESGYAGPDNPAFDALRELVHESGNS